MNFAWNKNQDTYFNLVVYMKFLYVCNACQKYVTYYFMLCVRDFVPNISKSSQSHDKHLSSTVKFYSCILLYIKYVNPLAKCSQQENPLGYRLESHSS